MVLGCGIDYALFVVTRHRKNLLNGMSVEDSIVAALNTSGRAVMFAGITVCIAILGLCALQVSFLYGVAIGTAIGVALTMVASLTLLPAMLGFIGLKVLPRKQRRGVWRGHRRPQRAPRRLVPLVAPHRAAPDAAGPGCADRAGRCWPSRSSASGWATPTRATTRPPRRPARATT